MKSSQACDQFRKWMESKFYREGTIESYVPCECMVNGVPYSDVNTSGKIQAGIDIINALTDHYKINAPVFIDNRESIVRLPECKSQIINLIVKEGQKLTVETEVTNSELFATA